MSARIIYHRLTIFSCNLSIEENNYAVGACWRPIDPPSSTTGDGLYGVTTCHAWALQSEGDLKPAYTRHGHPATLPRWIRRPKGDIHRL
jgi:hypothetical protein